MLKRKGGQEEEAEEAARAAAAAERARVTDKTTGLGNRSTLLSLLNKAVEHGKATSQRTAILFLHLGHVRDVNDTYGPDAGDQLLADAGRRIAAELGGDQRILRWSGAEYVLVAPGVSTKEAAESLAAGVFELLASPFEIAGNQISVTSSIGASLSDEGFDSLESWRDDAHDAMTAARELGNQGLEARDESTRNRMDIRITEDAIQKAVKNSEFKLLYQPIVRTADEHIVGFEALIRWLDPTASAKFVPPDKFLPLLEKTGLIIEVGEWVLNEAAHQCRAWNDRYAHDRDPFFMSVNLGARQMAHANFAGTVAKALDASGLRPELLTLDITPEALRFNRQATWAELRDLKYLGVRLSLDDFGVGEATISYLRDIQIDLLRVDGSFIRGLGSTPEDEAIVRHLVGLGLDLGILSVAEQVEEPRQLEKLRELNCGLAQGYLFGKPSLPGEVEQTIFA